jgi:hypothetical protein
MVDREKVIKGLECCTKDECECCPYENVCFGDDEVELFDTLARDALALLKAQEPEALDMPKPDSDIGCWYDITNNYTLEQVVSALKAQEPRVMTLEEAKSTYVVEYMSGKMREVGAALLDLDVDPLNAEYGKVYRVWTSRPTDEQREAIPWS